MLKRTSLGGLYPSQLISEIPGCLKILSPVTKILLRRQSKKLYMYLRPHKDATRVVKLSVGRSHAIPKRGITLGIRPIGRNNFLTHPLLVVCSYFKIIPIVDNSK